MLPPDVRQPTNDAFAMLCQCVEVVERSLIKISMFFDEEVLQTVIAIVSAA